MKVVQINQSDISGGAAIAGYRLHQGLLSQRVDSKLLVDKVSTNSDRVAQINRKRTVEHLLCRLSSRLGLNYTLIPSTFNLPKHPLIQEADILNFHNLHGEYFNYLAIPSLAKHKPIVFTLHDMWSFTGHCAYSFDCDKWKIGCGNCPYPQTYPSISIDNTRLEWKLKQWVYQRSRLTVVTPSYWLAKKAQESLLKGFPIHQIPYGIDTEAYQPLNQDQSCSLLNIPTGKKVLIAAAQSFKDSRKGGDLLLEALSLLPDSLKTEIILLTIGTAGEAFAETVGIQTINLGYIGGDRVKAIAYSAADLCVFPTRADNLPLVLQESMACGTPMVSFNVGGVPDLVRPNVTGYLAKPEDAKDFSQGIVQLLEDDTLREKMSANCRAIALQEYPIELQAKRYIELYQQVLDRVC